MKVDKALLGEIDAKSKSLKDKKGKGVSIKLAKKFKENLEREANAHSIRIEYPKAILYSSLSSRDKTKFKKKLRETKKDLEEAWKWANELQGREINDEFVLGLAGKICPDIFYGSPASYRRDQARILRGLAHPPRPEKVPYEMSEFLYSLRQNQRNNTVEQAVFAHYHLARIHPFNDGNGRTSRMVQNLILKRENLPPVIIKEGERGFYKELISRAIYEREQKEGHYSPKQIEFANYIASKINISLDLILDKIN